MTAAAYAEALYSLAEDENAAENIYNEIEIVADLFKENPELVKILDFPGDTKKKTALIDRCFGGQVHIYLLNCLKLMSEKRTVRYAVPMAEEYMRLYRQKVGAETAEIITAVRLDDSQLLRITAALEKSTGKKIIPKPTVDPKCMGGVIVRLENRSIDASVKTRLNEFEKKIKAVRIGQEGE